MGVQATIEFPALGQLIASLRTRGYEVVGPRVREGAVVYEPIERLEDLPLGWADQQAAGTYRLVRRDDSAAFGYNLGPQGWKRFLHPPEFLHSAVERDGDALRFIPSAVPAPRYAFLGVRACELEAIRILDRILMGDAYVDAGYQARRNGLFVAAVQCTQAAPTCFCTSLNTGPRVESGFDLALTELPGCFLVECGSETGAEMLKTIEHRAPTAEERSAAEAAVARAAGQIVRRLNAAGLKQKLYDSFDSPAWARVAERCLSCGNCTMVCPTCFCTTVEDTSDVTATRAERWRKWDSCFTDSFSYIHGGSVRLSVKSRYRQWLTHKLAAWVDQFGTPGCVGCGRCITWCPAKIDITEEVARVCGDDAAQRIGGSNGNEIIG